MKITPSSPVTNPLRQPFVVKPRQGKKPDIHHTTYLSDAFIKATPQRYMEVKGIITKTLTHLFGEDQIRQKIVIPKPHSKLEKISFVSHSWKVIPKKHHGAGTSSKGILMLHNGGVGEPSRLITHMQYGTLQPGQLWSGQRLTKLLGARLIDNIYELVTERELVNLSLHRMMGEKPSPLVWEDITQRTP
jgi:hypothetical protein